MIFIEFVTRKNIVLVIIFCFGVSILFLHSSELTALTNSFGDFKKFQNYTDGENTGNTLNDTSKLILFWTTFYNQADFWIGFGSTPFEDCPISHCETTNDRQRLAQSDAVVFHVRNMNLTDLPPFRPPHQRWIFFTYESPANTYTDNKSVYTSVVNMKHFFNWTMTYRTDSDIVRLYTENTFGNSFVEKEYDLLAKRLKEKTKLAAWIVSHCTTPNHREEYAKNLQKYIQVDIYGKCGHLKCKTNCYEPLASQYKFYLSFENSHYRDYVTEKFFNALKNDVVPVVYGAVNYSQFAPKGSFIDARDFESERHLADYLKYLDGNQTAYEEYFQWRKTMVLKRWCSGRHPPEEPVPYTAESQCSPKAWCQLCRMLNDPTLPSKSYADMYQWWEVESESHRNKPISTKRPEWTNIWISRS